MIAFMGYALIVIFMFVIMRKKMSLFIGLVFLPLLWAIIGQVLNLWQIDIGQAAMDGLGTTSSIYRNYAILRYLHVHHHD